MAGGTKLNISKPDYTSELHGRWTRPVGHFFRWCLWQLNLSERVSPVYWMVQVEGREVRQAVRYWVLGARC